MIFKDLFIDEKVQSLLSNKNQAQVQPQKHITQRKKSRKDASSHKNSGEKKKHKKHKKEKIHDPKFSSQSDQQMIKKRQITENAIQIKKHISSEASEIIYPIGSILKIKTSHMSILLGTGKIQFQIDILTQQSHINIINTFFDPKISKIEIKKNKRENQIIDHLNQTKKRYNFLICWIKPHNKSQGSCMKAICDETVKTQRIFGWQGSDDIKFHIMSVRQFVQIKRFKLPNNNLFNPFDDQILIIMQYPQKIHDIKNKYKKFSQIERMGPLISPIISNDIKIQTQISSQNKLQQIPISQTKIQHINYQQLLSKQTYSNSNIYYQGWTNLIPIQLPMQQIKKQDHIINNIQIKQKNMSLLQKLKLHFDFKSMQPVQSDQQSHKQKQDNNLADQLLNSLNGLAVSSPIKPPVNYKYQTYGENFYNDPNISYNYYSHQNKYYNYNHNIYYPPANFTIQQNNNWDHTKNIRSSHPQYLHTNKINPYQNIHSNNKQAFYDPRNINYPYREYVNYPHERYQSMRDQNYYHSYQYYYQEQNKYNQSQFQYQRLQNQPRKQK